MRKSSILLLLLLFMAASCGERLPKGILPEEKMILVMADMHLAEASMSVKKYMGVDAAAYYQHQYSVILRSHGLTEKEWQADFKYYTERPKLMNTVYTGVIEELHRKEVKAAKK